MMDASQSETGLYEVIYVSTLASGARIQAVGSIARHSRATNSKFELTGLLIFDGARFCQQLEGEKNAVLERLAKISEDSRHSNIRLVRSEPLSERRFKRFGMAYASISDEDVLEKLEQLAGPAAIDSFLQLLPGLDMEV
jgi:hypothetical protein